MLAIQCDTDMECDVGRPVLCVAKNQKVTVSCSERVVNGLKNLESSGLLLLANASTCWVNYAYFMHLLVLLGEHFYCGELHMIMVRWIVFNFDVPSALIQRCYNVVLIQILYFCENIGVCIHHCKFFAVHFDSSAEHSAKIYDMHLEH